jgi:group I intron endonuclease
MGNRIIRSGIYQIVNEVNGKSYVGSSIDINNRWSNWRRDFKKEMRYKSLLKSAVQKYGIENFTFIILEECEPTKEALKALEQHYIDTLRPTYNIFKTAYNIAGHKFPIEVYPKRKQSEDQKRKHREYQSARMADPENRAAVSQAMRIYRSNVKHQGSNVKGTTRGPETRLRIAEGLRNSESFKVSAERLKGKTNVRSFSGEYGIRWIKQTLRWGERLKGKSYGQYTTVEEAILRRNALI